jgi:hypothetical protein
MPMQPCRRKTARENEIVGMKAAPPRIAANFTQPMHRERSDSIDVFGHIERGRILLHRHRRRRRCTPPPLPPPCLLRAAGS